MKNFIIACLILLVTTATSFASPIPGVTDEAFDLARSGFGRTLKNLDEFTSNKEKMVDTPLILNDVKLEFKSVNVEFIKGEVAYEFTIINVVTLTKESMEVVATTRTPEYGAMPFPFSSLKNRLTTIIFVYSSLDKKIHLAGVSPSRNEGSL